MDNILNSEYRIIMNLSKTLFDSYDEEQWCRISFDICSEDDEATDFMAGYLIDFDDFDEVIDASDSVSGDMFHLAFNCSEYMEGYKGPGSIYMNLFISKDMPSEKEAWLYLHLKEMLVNILDEEPDYIAGYIRKETYNLIENNLDEQGYDIIDNDMNHLELLWRKHQ